MNAHTAPDINDRDAQMPAHPPGRRWQLLAFRLGGAFLGGSAFFLLAIGFVLQEAEGRELILGPATLPLLAAAHSLGLLVFLRTLPGWGWWKAGGVAVGAGALALAVTYLLEMLLPMLLSAGFGFGGGGGDNDNDNDSESDADSSSGSGHGGGWHGWFGGIEWSGSRGESAAAQGQHQQCPGCGRPTSGGACPSCRW